MGNQQRFVRQIWFSTRQGTEQWISIFQFYVSMELSVVYTWS